MIVVFNSDIELSEANEATAEAVSLLNKSDDGMERFLSSLPKGQLERILHNREALQALYRTMLASTTVPRKIYAAKLRGEALIGYVAVKGYGQTEPELQIEVSPDYQHKGYGREMLRQVLTLLFQDTDATDVFYRTRPNNAASIHLIESCGGVLQKPGNEAEALLLKTYIVHRFVPIK